MDCNMPQNLATNKFNALIQQSPNAPWVAPALNFYNSKAISIHPLTFLPALADQSMNLHQQI